MEFISRSEKETANFAKIIAAKSKGGDIFALQGDLGSGKTTFAKGFAAGLGIKKTVTSPTFVVMKEYPVTEDKRRIDKLIHIDAYRFCDVEDTLSIGLPEYIEDKKAVILVEWPEKVWPVIKNRAKLITFEYKNEHERTIRQENSLS